MTRHRYIPDFNTATKEELERIPGITEDLAETIVHYRDDRGGIRDFEELMNADGITQDTINRLKPWLTIEDDRAIQE
jgi:competence protein ComEA